MQTIDDIVVDFTPPVADRFLKQYNSRFHYVHQKNIKDSDSLKKPQSWLNADVTQSKNPSKNVSDGCVVLVNEEAFLAPC